MIYVLCAPGAFEGDVVPVGVEVDTGDVFKVTRGSAFTAWRDAPRWGKVNREEMHRILDEWLDADRDDAWLAVAGEEK